MNPILLQLGPFSVQWYGILIVTGALIAAYLCMIEARRRGEDPDHVWNLLTLALFLGIIGARLYHVFSTPTGNFVGWAYYREHPIEIIKIWGPGGLVGLRGLGIYGAVAGGVLAFASYCAYKRLSFPRWLDIATPGLMLAQAIGRMGNFINQELYGPATTLPWAFHINPAFPCQEPAGSPMACGLPDRLNDAARQWYAANGFHPTFFYEALWNIAGALIVWFGGRALAPRLRNGDVFCFYLMWYPLGRFWVELFRPDAWRIGTLATAQWIAIALFLVGLAGILVNHLRPRPVAEPAQ